MKVTEEALLKSGFSPADVQKINNYVEGYGGTPEEAIKDLSNRFRALGWITTGCCFVFIFMLLFSSKPTIVGGGISLLIAVIIATFIQPPMLAFRAWRYCRTHQTNDDFSQ